MYWGVSIMALVRSFQKMIECRIEQILLGL
jgi:hypothetical protein